MKTINVTILRLYHVTNTLKMDHYIDISIVAPSQTCHFYCKTNTSRAFITLTNLLPYFFTPGIQNYGPKMNIIGFISLEVGGKKMF